jgi:hypothetical protein
VRVLLRTNSHRDERLHLRVLIKGEADDNLDPSLSQRSWTEALALAQKVGDAGWANCARGELGFVAFLQAAVSRTADVDRTKTPDLGF